MSCTSNSNFHAVVLKGTHSDTTPCQSPDVQGSVLSGDCYVGTEHLDLLKSVGLLSGCSKLQSSGPFRKKEVTDLEDFVAIAFRSRKFPQG